MADLAIHPETQRQLDVYHTRPAHALILIGSTGSGKATLAIRTAERVLAIPSFVDSPYGLIISPTDGRAIGIEAVRQLEQFLALKVPGTKPYNRAIVIEDAHALTTEAQNALLKTLEEPPEGTIIILTANHEQALLPTIRSRAQTIAITRPDKAALTAAFRDFDTAAFKRAYAVSGGLPGLMDALLTDAEHPLATAVERARQLLSQTMYERMLAVDELAKQRETASDVAFILQQMAHVSLQSSQGAAADKWQNVLTASYEAGEALATSAQPKLVLTKLMLAL